MTQARLAVQREMQRLRSDETTTTERIHIMIHFSRFTMRENRNDPERQMFLAEHGALETLVSFSASSRKQTHNITFADEDEEELFQRCALTALSQICSWNVATSKLVGENARFIDVMKDLLKWDYDTTRNVRLTAMNVLYNILNNCFDCHASLLCFIPDITHPFTTTDYDSDVLAWCCNVIYNFTLNPQSLLPLAQQNVPATLISAQSKILPPWAYVVIAMALANISTVTDYEKWSDFDCNVHDVCDCFRSSLFGDDYPQHSGVFFDGWEVAMAIANLSAIERHKQALVSESIFGLLSTALESATDKRLIKYSLLGLWRVTS
eukprot:c28_g1_i1.p1 GENE.c28_g1_i1~~c28_g1_i1.p1  ORF type:complete len:322 (+),score=61.13 c28_g1_i1:38-1003(+)